MTGADEGYGQERGVDELPDEVEFVDGLMDGYRMPVRGWTVEARRAGVAHMCDLTEYGPGGRAWYGPPEGHPVPERVTRWVWEGSSA